jgi:hypothetical protein
MDYCGPRGIPLSAFLTWPDPDQDAALYWQKRERERCGSCGTHPDDWRRQFGGDPHWEWKAKQHYCRGCEIHAMYADAADPQAGVSIRLIRSGYAED